MTTICICLPEDMEGILKAREHFASVGLENVEFFWGINAKVAGLSTCHPYEVDSPGSGYRMGAKSVGTWLSHYMLWSSLLRSSEDKILIIESDAKFLPGWKEKLDAAMKIAPSNFDFLNIGPCCMESHERELVSGDVYSTDYAFCTHSYVIRRDCIMFLLKTMRKCWAPIDIQLTMECYPHLNTYAVFPRLVEQFNTVLPV